MFRIGDRVRVKVALVSTEKRQIDFTLIESKEEDGSTGERKPVKGGRRESRKTDSTGKKAKSGKKNAATSTAAKSTAGTVANRGRKRKKP
jgi:ribonuclease R